MYRVYYSNFGWYADQTFGTFAEALQYAKSKCYEVAIYSSNVMMAAWSPIGGLRKYDNPPVRRDFIVNRGE